MLTESGAFKALTLDLCEEIGLPLPPLAGATEAALRAAIPPFIPVSNPTDLTAQALVDPDLYRCTLEPLLADGSYGSVVLGIIQTDEAISRLKFEPILRAIEALVARYSRAPLRVAALRRNSRKVVDAARLSRQHPRLPCLPRPPSRTVAAHRVPPPAVDPVMAMAPAQIDPNAASECSS